MGRIARFLFLCFNFKFIGTINPVKMRLIGIIFWISVWGHSPILGQPSTPESAPTGKQVAINWLTWDEAMSLYEKEQKKLMISIYTNWCNWCKKMDTGTFGEPQIAALVNDYFYPVKLDAQCMEDLVFKGKIYKNRNEGPNSYHDLAMELLLERRSFPTIVFLDERQRYIQAIVGYKTASEFETIASYFGHNNYKRTPWSAYAKNFKSVLSLEKNR